MQWQGLGTCCFESPTLYETMNSLPDTDNPSHVSFLTLGSKSTPNTRDRPRRSQHRPQAGPGAHKGWPVAGLSTHRQQRTDIGNKRDCPMGFCPLLRNRQQLLGPGRPAWRPLCTPIPSADLVRDLVVDTCGELKDPPSSPHSGPMQAAMKHPGDVSDAAQPPHTMSRRERKSGVFCRQSRIHHVTDRA